MLLPARSMNVLLSMIVRCVTVYASSRSTALRADGASGHSAASAGSERVRVRALERVLGEQEAQRGGGQHALDHGEHMRQGVLRVELGLDDVAWRAELLASLE